MELKCGNFGQIMADLTIKSEQIVGFSRNFDVFGVECNGQSDLSYLWLNLLDLCCASLKCLEIGKNFRRFCVD